MLLLLQINIPNIYAQDYTQWELPDGAIARLGKGRINDMQYSPDGSILAVATTIGIWVYDTDTYQEQALLSRSHQEMEKVYFNHDGTVLTGMEMFGNKITHWDVTLLKIKKSSTNRHDFLRHTTYSSDGNTFATKSFKEIQIRDSKTNTSKYILKGHGDNISCLVYSPDDKIIASGSHDQTVRLWDVETGKQIRMLRGHQDNITFLSFSPDGSTLISISRDMTINFWDITSGELKLPFAIQGVISDKIETKEKIKRTFFSPDRSILITAGESRTIHLWDSTTGKLKQTFSDKNEDKKETGYISGVEDILFSPDGKSILSLVKGYEIRMWDIATGKRRRFTGNTGYVSDATFSPDGKTLATADYPGGIRIWEIMTGKLKRTISNLNPRDSLHRTQHDIYSIAFIQKGEKVVISEAYGAIISLFDTGTKRLHTLMGKTNSSDGTWSNDVLVSPNGETVASWSASKDGLIRFWNADTGEHKRTIKDNKGPIKGVVFRMDSTILASWSYEDKAIRLWNVATGRLTQRLTGHDNLIESVAFSPDGETLISGGRDETILIWDVSTGKHKTLTEQEGDNERNTHSNSIMVLMFNSDGSKLATGDQKGNIRLWDVSTWKEEQTLDGHADAITSIDFSPDDLSIASTGKDGTVRLWDIGTGQQIQSISGDNRIFWYVMFYPNGLILATEVAGINSRFHTEIINLWNLRTGERMKTLPGHSRKITGLSFSTDGNTIASFGFDDIVLLWDLTSIIQELDIE